MADHDSSPTTADRDIVSLMNASSGEFVAYLGLEMTEVSGDRVEARWTAGAKHHQPYGIVHGGVHCSVVETLASVGAAVWYGDRGQCVGVSNTTDFMRAVREGELTSVATPIHQGRTQQLWLVETTEDATGKLLSRGQVRIQNLPRRDAGDDHRSGG